MNVASQYDRYDEATIRSAGVPIVLSCYRAAPQAPVVVFLPGTMVHPLFYDDFLSRLAQAGLNVVGVHFVSHGKSPRIREDFTVSDLLENVRDTLDYCAARFGGPLFLLGSSQGGIVATAAADDPRITAVFAHDAMLPGLEESTALLNLPCGLRRFARPILSCVKAAARIAPRFQISLSSYLDPRKLTDDEAVVSRYLNDPLCRKSYPLGFLASLFHADMHVATDGSIRCPYVMIAAKGDRLFRFEYVQKVFDAIKAPEKELMTFGLASHMLFIEHFDTVAGPIAERMKRFADETAGV